MSLSAGTKLGPYEITGEIGAGGMGEVYRATDSKLGRDVAIKTLPAALASDKDRLARFEREAKLLAALNHPHIASIFSLDDHDGTIYLAMELIEGETLEEKLKPGALPVEEALRLALQIAEALEAAHEKGVVHRDLKPANVMVTNDGIVKVLDFGLAKAFSEDPNDSNVAQSPALSVAMTQQGLVLGTAGYMSPEQASGQPTDQRADVWAFGVVLYEMLTGLPLFSGESVPHILADVLKTEPDWNRLPRNLHPLVRHALERCLTKKPRNRYHSIADARIDIQQVLSDPAGLLLAPVVSGGAPLPSMARRAGVAASLLAVGAAVAGMAVWFVIAPESAVPSVRRFDYDIPEGMRFFFPSRPVLALSTDGERFVLNLDGDLYLRRMSELEANLIEIPDQGIGSPFFSPDGQSIAYNIPSRFLQRISISGGAAVPLTELNDYLMGAIWSEDGQIYYGQPDGIYSVSGEGGDAKRVIPAESGERLAPSQLLPDGDSILFSADKTGNWDTAEIVVASVSTGDRIKTVYRGGRDARYVDTGHLTYVYEDKLFGIAFDLETLTVSGPPVQLESGLVTTTEAPANYGFSDGGTLVYLAGRSLAPARSGFRSLVWVDRAGAETPVDILTSCNCGNVELSPDGTRIAVDEFNNEGVLVNRDIWIYSLEAEGRTRLTTGALEDAFPIWTSTGERIVYFAQGEGISSHQANGTSTTPIVMLENTDRSVRPYDSDEDGNVIFVTDGLNSRRDIYVLDIETGEQRPLLDNSFREDEPALSPDGRWLAYVSDETGEPEVYVRPYPDIDSGKEPVSIGGGRRPRWSSDGGSLFYLGPTHLMETGVETEPSFRRETPLELFSLEGLTRFYDVRADGERFLFIKTLDNAGDQEGGGQWRVVIVENWIEELKRLVPTE